MILLHADDRKSIDKGTDIVDGSTIRIPEHALGPPRSRNSDVSSLPDYDTSEKEHRTLAQQPDTQAQKQKSRFYLNARFWKISSYVMAVYVVLSLAIAIPLVLKFKRNHESLWAFVTDEWSSSSCHGPGLDYNAKWNTSAVSNSTFLWGWQDVDHGLCDEFSSVEYEGTLADVVPSPLTASIIRAGYVLQDEPHQLVAIRSNFTQDGTFPGNLIQGILSVDVNPDELQHNIIFNVTVNASNQRTRSNTRICFRKEGRNRGLSIYPPKSVNETDSITVAIQVLLPQASTIDDFVTYLPSLSQHFGDLSAVKLGHVGIEGAAAPLMFELKHLPSSPIDATVALGHFETSEAKVNTPYFVTQVKSYNGKVNLDFAHDYEPPTIATLRLDVQNALAETNVRLDPGFQGEFLVQTRLAQVNVTDGVQRQEISGNNTTSVPLSHTNVSDAVEEGRITTYDDLRTDRAVGWVGWSARPKSDFERLKQGRVSLRSSMGPINLDLV
ncbi:hypothetical protein CC1G_04538 [Coprinopsis cinerea okayama7|uniref:Uncharacterized protein n=1 Tax=Coprinopsis cinerea (strain Okayama-7 / 130 / ATCC MYA-4618 / FGSC 9003) TaxID=240176 RepID=A8N5G0_COPC7|nr:hypothetical protein CC1G_04538 [Coprinopsis cinerea okayama7\|eukprot:XP_001830105.2 hypothetical protein CC1G_04538 [Coprinopsis cinerea okayama7\